MRFSTAKRRAKLVTLMEIEGYDGIEDLAQAILSDSVSPAICMKEGLRLHLRERAGPGRGYCEECRTNSMQSALTLADLI